MDIISQRVFSAEALKKVIGGDNEVFITFGYTTTPYSGNPPDYVPSANVTGSTVAYEYDAFKHLIAGKKLTGTEVRLGTVASTWTANTVYDIYDDKEIMFSHVDRGDYSVTSSKDFFILTDDNNVYKCLFNNNNSISTVKPTSVLTDQVTQTSDGYIWKFMFNISDNDMQKYSYDDGSGKVIIPIKTLGADDGSLQWSVQTNANPGGLYSIIVTAGGSDYDANTIISINGDGISATATANIVNGAINRIDVTNPGTEYTIANVVVSGVGSGATTRAIISPPGGHGSNPLYELGGDKIILAPDISGSEDGTIPTTNRYYQWSLLKDPTSNGEVFTGSTFDQTTRLALTGTNSNFQENEIVYQGTSPTTATFTARVHKWDSANSVLALIETVGSISSDIVIGQNTFATGFVTSVTSPDLDKYSGQFLFINTWTNSNVYIQRAEDQDDSFLIILNSNF